MISQDSLEQQVLLLASRDWKTRRAARDVLIAAGGAGLSAAVEGLQHPEPPVRRGCVDFLDHHADDDCVDDLRRVALHDPIPQVRRFAVHALSCVRCKASPLGIDLIEFFAMIAARSDESAKGTEGSYIRAQPSSPGLSGYSRTAACPRAGDRSGTSKGGAPRTEASRPRVSAFDG